MTVKRRIGLIGRVDLRNTLFDGQTVKTRTIYSLMAAQYGAENISLVETLEYKRRALQVAFATVRCFFTTDDIVVLLSRNGRRVFFPLLYIASKYFRKRIYHNLIGGWLADDLPNYPSWVKYLNQFEINWVESELLVTNLQNAGVTNAEYLPNFKMIEPLNENELSGIVHNRLSLCTFSRVVEGKGIGEAISAVESLQDASTGTNFTLDIYGPIAPEFSEEFERLLAQASNARYMGSVDPSKSVETLRQYDALLFPTKWYLEGIPGTIIDALHAGVPVIASKWQYYDEVLADGLTGFGYDFSRPDDLVTTIELLPRTETSYLALRKSALEHAKKFSYMENFRVMTDRIDRVDDSGPSSDRI